MLTKRTRDRKLTLSQNYKLLGLSSRLNHVSGGSEKKATGDGTVVDSSNMRDSLAISGPRAGGPNGLAPQEVQVERDPETGRIVRVIRPEDADAAISNPLNDPLNDLMDTAEESETRQQPRGVVAQLEAQAMEEEELLAKKRKPRQQSRREEEWIAELIAKHGDNVRAMARDKKLNPMQQTEADIGRRIKKYKANHDQVAT